MDRGTQLEKDIKFSEFYVDIVLIGFQKSCKHFDLLLCS